MLTITVSMILNSISIVLICLSCLISIFVLIRILIRIRPSISNISVLLTCNTYFTIILLCLTLLYSVLYSLYGHIHPSISLAGRWCEFRGYIPFICFCAFYYSFVLQAIFRFFRVVYYKKRILQQFYVFITGIIIQWILSFLCILPHILLQDFQYQQFDYACWISFRNIRGIVLITISIYGSPLLIIFLIYAHLLQYVHRTIATQRERQRSYKRDTIILRRIVIVILFLVLFGVSTLSVLVIYSITSYLIPFAHEIQTVNTSIGLVSTPIILIFITPRIRHIFQRKSKIQYTPTSRRHIQHLTTDSSRQGTDNYS